MKAIYYLVDVANVILSSLADTIGKSLVSFVLFVPLLALCIPFMIWYSERERKGNKLDYPH